MIDFVGLSEYVQVCVLVSSLPASVVAFGWGVTHLLCMCSHMNKTFAVLFRSMLFSTHTQISSSISPSMLMAHICGHLCFSWCSDICVKTQDGWGRSVCVWMLACMFETIFEKVIRRVLYYSLEYPDDVLHSLNVQYAEHAVWIPCPIMHCNFPLELFDSTAKCRFSVFTENWIKNAK